MLQFHSRAVAINWTCSCLGHHAVTGVSYVDVELRQSPSSLVKIATATSSVGKRRCIDTDIGNLCIKWQARLQHFGKRFPRIFPLQQWSIASSRSSIEERSFFPASHTTAPSRFKRPTFFSRNMIPPPVTMIERWSGDILRRTSVSASRNLSSPHVEKICEIGDSKFRAYHLISIKARKAGSLLQTTPDCGFAFAHHADEDDRFVGTIHHAR